MANRSYSELLSSAALNFELWRGHIQNLGTASMTMAYNGTPRFTNKNKTNVFLQGNSQYIASGVIPYVVDVTGTFTVECAVLPLTKLGGGSALYQKNNGGFQLYYVDPATGENSLRWVLVLYNNAGGDARYIYTDAMSLNQTNHFIIQSTTGGTAGSLWINGSPVTPLLAAGAGVAANCANIGISVMGYGAATSMWTLVRAFPGTISNDEASVLYGAYRTIRSPLKT